ncbi:helix-turn-helix domain-containing protein [Aliikangiella maris]|uniref:Helix-turn-helix domain-containing protein n=2 Tax=Aliikangiella maris TaxID=3162458 RepID=A0ABV3MSA4_9GAMM
MDIGFLIFESRLLFALFSFIFIMLIAKTNRIGAMLLILILLGEIYSCSTILAVKYGVVKSFSVCALFFASLQCCYPVLMKAYVEALNHQFHWKKLFPAALFPLSVLTIYFTATYSPDFNNLLIAFLKVEPRIQEIFWFGICYTFCLFAYSSIPIKKTNLLPLKFLKFSIRSFQIAYGLVLAVVFLRLMLGYPDDWVVLFYLPAKILITTGVVFFVISFGLTYLTKHMGYQFGKVVVFESDKSHLSQPHFSDAQGLFQSSSNEMARVESNELTSLRDSQNSEDMQQDSLQASQINASNIGEFNFGDQPSAGEIYQQVCQVLDEESFYRNPNIRLTDIAKRLGLSERKVSKAIKEQGMINFRYLINKKRVNYVIAHLQSTLDKPNLLELSFEAGFNSKSSFNRAFKNCTNLNPTEYLNSLQS